VVVDRVFSDPVLAERYDLFCEGRPDFAFYLAPVMCAASVLDVGCGTGELLRRAREAGHQGRLCGLDPAAAMLDQARRRADVEWVLGDAATMAWDRTFDLVVMTGHAFQVLLDDDEVRASLVAVRSALNEGGRFVFETRNPSARAWEQWTPDHQAEFVGADGLVVRVTSEVEQVDGDLVRFTQTFTSPSWGHPRVSRSTLRFLDAAAVASLLAGAGLAVLEQLGSWDGRPLDDDSPEIISVAGRAGPRRPARSSDRGARDIRRSSSTATAAGRTLARAAASELRSRSERTKMAEHPNVGRVRDAYAAFAAGDLDAALKDLADNAVFHFHGDGPISGDHRGRADIEKALIATFELTGGTQTLDISGIYADDEHAVVALHETATRTDGATLDVDEAHVIKIDRDGKITDLWDLPTDPDVHDRFFDGK
jgi:SAM-dependent methyltransferase